MEELKLTKRNEELEKPIYMCKRDFHQCTIVEGAQFCSKYVIGDKVDSKQLRIEKALFKDWGFNWDDYFIEEDKDKWN